MFSKLVFIDLLYINGEPQKVSNKLSCLRNIFLDSIERLVFLEADIYL